MADRKSEPPAPETSRPAIRRGGRPPRAKAQQIRDDILTIATPMFLEQGYGATSIEAIAKQAGMSKRTFYHRFANKAELFSAVVHRLMTRLRPRQVAPLFTGGSLRDILLRIGTVIQRASLTPDALALHRLMLTEATRFPELTRILDQEGARKEAVERIAELLLAHADPAMVTPDHATMLAEQFMQLIVAVPQRRALGLGAPLSTDELGVWVKQAVDLFLRGSQLKNSASS